MRGGVIGIVLLLIAVAITGKAEAQVLVFQQQKCDMAQVEQIGSLADSIVVPIWQELVDEGKLVSANSAYHLWGDEWNVVYWFVAESVPTFLEAASEMFARFGERHPDGWDLFFDACFEHKDSFYYMGGGTSPAPSAPGQ